MPFDPCIDKPRKPMVPLKTLDIIFRRRYLQNTQFYFTNRRHALPKSGEKLKPVKSFRVPKSEKLLSYIKYSDRKEKNVAQQRLKQPLYKKDNLRIAATRDMSQRLYIKSKPDDVRCVVEIHPEFYTVIEGRPLRAFDDIKVYVSNIRNYAMYRQQIGYRRDIILRIEQSMTDETKEVAAVASNLRQHIKNFQKFLTEDFRKACAKVAKAEKLHDVLEAKIQEFLGYVVQLSIINNVIFKLDAIRNVLKTYRTYLMFCAPLYWREQFDEAYQSVSFQIDEGEFVTSSGEFVTTENDLVETLDIDNIVAAAKIEFKNPALPHLYFSTPKEMEYLFRTMELQSREYLIQISKTRDPYKLLLYRIKQLKSSTKLELDASQYIIDSISKEIDRELYNETYFKSKFMRILNESFYDTVASPDVLKLKICIEYVFEEIFGKCEEGHQSLHDPMKILEVTYEEYNLKLDGLDFKTVTEARNDLFAQDRAMMVAAYKAERELKMFAEMTNAMKKAFLPPAKFKPPVFTKFMSKKEIMALEAAKKREAALARGERIKRKKVKVTEEEFDNLTMFTDWCDDENPAPYLKEVEQYVKPVFRMKFRASAAPPLLAKSKSKSKTRAHSKH